MWRAAEAAVQTVLRARARRRAERVLRGMLPTEARGRACHCPPGLEPHLVHSEGLREACDLVVDFGSNVAHPARPQVPVAALREAARRLPPGAAVHVKTDLLAEFAAELLPVIPGDIVLVTGDSDAAAPGARAELLEHPKIRHWFAQNCDRAEPHPRLTPIPIGCDNPVYTKEEKRLGFALTMLLGRTAWDASVSRNDIGDQATLLRVRAELPPTAARPRRALCTFHRNEKLIAPDLERFPERREAWAALRDNPCCHFVPRRLRQEACWRVHGEFAFEVSPRGNGPDCFRTWEALALGTIPIVRMSPLDRLYRENGFPVAIVGAWSEITPAALERWHAELAGRFDAGLLARLGNAHWTERIRKASRAAGA